MKAKDMYCRYCDKLEQAARKDVIVLPMTLVTMGKDNATTL